MCYSDLLWKAPELLREPSAVPTIQSDVYAFGILVHELVHRRGPFGVREDGHDPSEVEIKSLFTCSLLHFFFTFLTLPRNRQVVSTLSTGYTN